MSDQASKNASNNASKSASNSTSNEQKTKEEEEERIWNNELEIDYERILSIGEECISSNELKTLILKKGRGTDVNKPFLLYDGFEPSGRMHIAQGVFKAMNVNKCTLNGTNSKFIFWVADWFALMNDKMGGDINKIKIVGEYLIEVWKAAGMNINNVIFKWASIEITENASKYWPIMLDIARRFTINRIKKCCQIMGRLENKLTSAQILYPLMQCTDVFFLNADICQLGVDQRKVNMLAREYCDYSKRKTKPIILSHHMLYGLKKGQEKMSKSDPDSAIFMEDTIEDVQRKINNAYCPSNSTSSNDEINITTPPSTTGIIDAIIDAGKESMQLIEDKLKNPCLDYIKNIIFSPPDSTFTVVDIEDESKAITYNNYDTVQQAFLTGIITEQQLKKGLINQLNILLEPVRQHFTTNDRAKELLSLVQQYKKETSIPDNNNVDKIIRRLELVKLNKIPSNTHLVFVPFPIGQPTLQSIIDTLQQIRCKQSDQKCILYIQDWSAIVSNACGADIKVINAYYTIFISTLKALDNEIMNDENVQILYQSEAILLDPSNYWISVINIGRHFMLHEIMGDIITDDDNVGLVIARLMTIADVASIEPLSIAYIESDSTTTNNNNNNNSVAQLESNLIKEFFDVKLIGLTLPTIHILQSTSIRLQPIRESDALKTENDEYFILDDPKVHGKSKIKKAFCEPGNITFCPPIILASVFALSTKNGTFEIQRSIDNGGNKIYTTINELNNDFQQGETILHPGDLKNSITLIIMNILETISNNIQSDKVTLAASKTLKTFLKKKK